MTGVTAAPSWVLSTLQWLEVKHPAYVTPGKSSSHRLKRALERMSFQKVESTMAGESITVYSTRLDNLVERWDDELHRQMIEFLNEGGYVKEREEADLLLAASKAKVDDKTRARTPKPASKGAPPPAGEQDLDEIVQQELLSRDKRLGAW